MSIFKKKKTVSNSEGVSLDKEEVAKETFEVIADAVETENKEENSKKDKDSKKDKREKKKKRVKEPKVKKTPVKKKERKSWKDSLFKGNKTPKASSEALISLDFGSREIKGVYGKVQGDRIKVNKCFSTVVKENWYQNGSIEDVKEGQAVLREMFDANKLPSKNIVCTIDSTNIVKREIVIPKVSKEDIDSLLYYEMSQYLPIDPGEYVIQYLEIEDFVENEIEKLRLLVTVVPKSIVEGMLNFLKGMKLIPYALDVHSNSLKKLIEFNSGHINDEYVADKTIVLLDIGNKHSDIIVFKEGRFQFNNILEFGYADFKHIIFNGLALTGEELHKKTSQLVKEMLNQSYTDEGIEVEPGDDIYENINQYLIRSLYSKTEMFIGEIDRSLKYYTTQNAENHIDKIYLYGGSSLECDLSPLMQEKLEIPVAHMKFMGAVDWTNVQDKDVSQYWNALGALIRL
ncbi:MAG: pilus assembly protein PilM [Filifactor alocis]|nr:pilus assembly protein PilM [Filifactor alocis]